MWNMSMIFLGKLCDSHGGFSTSMVHVREKLQDPGAESHHRLRRGAPRLARRLGSENWAWNVDLLQVAEIC